MVAPGVHVYMTGNHGPNAVFVVGTREVLLVDSLMTTKQSRKLREAIQGVTDLPVSTLVYTHHHGDHVLGAETFAPIPTVVASVACATFLHAMGESYLPLYASWRRTPQDAADVLAITTVVRPTVAFDSELTLYLDDMPILLKQGGPGHSPSDVRVFLPEHGVLITGDLLSHHGVPGMRDGRAEGWLQRLDEMYDMDPAVIVPGHGQWTTNRQVIRDFRDFMGAAWEASREGFARGESVEQVVESIDVSRWSGFHDMKRYREVIGRMFEELEGRPSKYDLALVDRLAASTRA